MRAFVNMRHYVGNVEAKVLEHDEKIKLLQKSFDKLQEKKIKSDIYYSGQIYDAYSVILDIFTDSKKD